MDAAEPSPVNLRPLQRLLPVIHTVPSRPCRLRAEHRTRQQVTDCESAVEFDESESRHYAPDTRLQLGGSESRPEIQPQHWNGEAQTCCPQRKDFTC